MTSSDQELDDFFKELSDSGVLSATALKELQLEHSQVLQASSLGRIVAEGGNLSDATPEQDLRAKIQDMSIAEKIKLAMLGDATCRSLLIIDSNRLVQQGVLSNPRLQIGEVEAFAKNSNVADFVLRNIANNRTWVKSYTVKLNLVANPKTPNDLALRWLRHINKNDLRRLAKSKSIPQLVAISARKLLAQMEK